MPAVPPQPPAKRMRPGSLTVLAWCAGLTFTCLLRMRLPGEWQPTILAGELVFRWDGLTVLGIATALVVTGSGQLLRRPLTACTLVLAGAAVASTTLGVAEIPLLQFLAADVAVWTVAAHRPRRTGLAALALALVVPVGYLAVRLSLGWAIGTSETLMVMSTAVIAWLIGDSTRSSREHAEELRAQTAVQAVTDERLRIAREVHDMVAHSMGVIALQAGAARRVIDTQPEQARVALAEIESAGRETLAGLRRVLGAIRQAERHGHDPQNGRHAMGAEGDRTDPHGASAAAAPGRGAADPAPGLDAIGRLAEVTTTAGVRVDVRWQGQRRRLPAEVERAAYRIVQESITNVVRHSGSRSCQVSIDLRDDEVLLEIVDGGSVRRDPRTPPPGGDSETGTGPGTGIIGMRERAALLNGELAAGPLPGGGFRVAARLPVLTAAVS